MNDGLRLWLVLVAAGLVCGRAAAAVRSITVVATSPAGAVVETSSAYPDYELQIVRRDGRILRRRALFRLPDHKTWIVRRQGLGPGETFFIRLLRRDEKKGRPVEEANLSFVHHPGRVYRIRSKTWACEGSASLSGLWPSRKPE